MKILTTALKILLRVIVGFFIFVAIYFLGVLMLSNVSVPKEPGASNDVTIYLVTDGIHTDIILPVKNRTYDWSRRVKYQYTLARDTTLQYLAFGWGDKAFYLQTPGWADLDYGVAIKAALGLTPSAIHTVFCNKPAPDKNCKMIYLSASQYSRLTSYLLKSFGTNNDGNLIPIKTDANYNVHDTFYEANGHYSIFFTCNTWVNNALKSCGQKACLWTPFASGIINQYH